MSAMTGLRESEDDSSLGAGGLAKKAKSATQGKLSAGAFSKSDSLSGGKLTRKSSRLSETLSKLRRKGAVK